MNLCSDNHDEVCFEGRICPACYALSEKQSEINDLESKIDTLELHIGDLKSQMKDLEAQMDGG